MKHLKLLFYERCKMTKELNIFFLFCPDCVYDPIQICIIIFFVLYYSIRSYRTIKDVNIGTKNSLTHHFHSIVFIKLS